MEHAKYGFPQQEQAYMNGKSLNPPRVHDFDEGFRKESQMCSISCEEVDKKCFVTNATQILAFETRFSTTFSPR